MNTPHLDNPIKGIFFALAAALMLASMNMFAKLLGSYLGPIEITFYRNLVAMVLLLIGLVGIRKIYLIKTARPWAQFIRALVGTIGMVFSMWAVILLPLTTATTLIFTSPLFVVLLSYPLLKEKVGIWRLFAVLVGFSGIIIIAQPTADTSLFAITIGVIAGFLNGLVAICLRWLGNTENTATTNFYFFLYGLIGTSLALPFIGEVPQIEATPAIIGIGIVGMLSLLFKTQGFRLGPAALISPISYTMMIWAVLYDYFIWDSLPTVNVLIGAAIIVFSNLFIIWREHKKNDK